MAAMKKPCRGDACDASRLTIMDTKTQRGNIRRLSPHNGCSQAFDATSALAESRHSCKMRRMTALSKMRSGYGKTLLCFLQLFVVSSLSDTWYFANNNNRHFGFNADERFLPLYQFANEDSKKITHLDSFAQTFLAKCNLAQMISRYMVLVASEQKMLMMRRLNHRKHAA